MTEFRVERRLVESGQWIPVWAYQRCLQDGAMEGLQSLNMEGCSELEEARGVQEAS